MTFHDNEIPSGVVDGVNTVFLLVDSPDPTNSLLLLKNRSEERRVGKECRSRWSPYH